MLFSEQDFNVRIIKNEFILYSSLFIRNNGYSSEIENFVYQKIQI